MEIGIALLVEMVALLVLPGMAFLAWKEAQESDVMKRLASCFSHSISLLPVTLLIAWGLDWTLMAEGEFSMLAFLEASWLALLVMIAVPWVMGFVWYYYPVIKFRSVLMDKYRNGSRADASEVPSAAEKGSGD